jgi:hypothetical protein
MGEKEKRKLSALGMAKRSASIIIELTPEDIRRFRPAWSGPEAEYFLELHKSEIGHMLLETGLSVLAKLIEQYEAEARYDRYDN